MKRLLGMPSAVLVLCLFSVFAVHAQQSYLLRSNGRVLVNGVPVPATSVVSAGDVIETAKGSMAKIASPGMSMLVGENSHVSVKGGTLAVDKGSASVTSNTGTSIAASQYSITPSGVSNAKYQIANTGSSLSVSSSNGPIAVSSGSGVTQVPTGQVAVISSNMFALTSASNSLVDSSSASFNQTEDLEASHVCRNAKNCLCKSNRQCATFH
jgi:hypothetical protein